MDGLMDGWMHALVYACWYAYIHVHLYLQQAHAVIYLPVCLSIFPPITKEWRGGAQSTSTWFSGRGLCTVFNARCEGSWFDITPALTQ